MEPCAPDFSKLVESIENQEGIFIDEIPAGTVVEVHTQNSIYEIAVIDAKDGKIAIRGNGRHFSKPEICRLSGSLWSGPAGPSSSIRQKYIGLNMHLELVRAIGTYIITTPIERIELKDDPKVAKELVDSAKPYVN